MKRGTKPKVKGVRCWAVIFDPDGVPESGGGACYLGQMWIFNSQAQAEDVKAYGDSANYSVVEVEIRPIQPKQKRRKKCER